MSSASWITLPDLGSYLENYNFNLNPIELELASDANATVKLINGALPAGLRWRKNNNIVVIEGQSEGVAVSTGSNFTLRITDPDGTLADRTFYIVINPFAISPSWQGQPAFLGYATIGVTARFSVQASIATDSSIVYRLVQAPVGMTIDTVSGNIVYTPPLSIIPVGLTEPYSTDFFFKIRATANNSYEDLVAKVTVLESGHPPVWQSVQGQLGVFVSEKYVETVVTAYDPDGNDIQYELIDPPADFPLTLTATGFLYGRAPLYADETVLEFEVSATSANGSTEGVFNVLITQDTTGGLLFWNGNTVVFDNIVDGNTIEIDVGATSTRFDRVVNHRLIGGTLPPTLTLNNSQGKLAGFVEYHPQPRNYLFEIEANDGLQTISRKYQIAVKRSINDQFMSIGFPVMGEIKNALVETRRAMFENAALIPYSNTLRDDVATEMNLIKGLSYADSDPDAVFENSNAYLTSTTLSFGPNSNVVVDSNNSKFYFRSVVDPLKGADYSIYNPDNQLTITPPSLDNMRRSLIESFAYATNGRGEAAQLLPKVNFETTGIEQVQIVQRGTGYYFAPKPTVVGTGTGAVISCRLSVNSITVRESSAGWATGELIDFFVDKQHVLELEVVATDLQDKLTAIQVKNTVEFSLFPQGVKVITNSSGATAEIDFDLGISSVTVIEPGVGYADVGTTIDLNGSEMLESWETEWQPYLPIDTVISIGNLQVSTTETETTLNILGSKNWKVQHIVVTAEGKSWTGNTVFDQDVCSFDGGQTRFVEWVEPYNTIFELNDTRFEQTGTRFDDNPEFVRTAYDQWGNTVFDAENTIFDLYDTILDMAGPSDKSITQVKRLYRITSPRITINNQVT